MRKFKMRKFPNAKISQSKYLNVSFILIQLGSLPTPGCLPELPIFSMAVDGQSSWNRLTTTPTKAQQEVPGTISMALAVPRLWYDPTAALSPKLVTRILSLKFVEMVKLIPNAWHENAMPFQTESRHRGATLASHP